MEKPSLTIINMIDNFLCPGCMNGYKASENCKSFELVEDDNGGYKCGKHFPGTTMGYPIILGLPPLFSSIGFLDKEKKRTYVRVYEAFQDVWDENNVPVWAGEKDGYLFVKTFWALNPNVIIEVFKDGKVSDIPYHSVNVTSRM